MTVVAMEFFETPLKVANVWTCGRDGDDTLKWASKSGRVGTPLCSAPVIVWSDIVNNLLRSGQTVGDFAQAHGQHGLEAIRIPSIKIPDLIATLVHNGSWTHLIGMRRWQAFEPLLPASWKLSRHERLPESLHESPHDRDDLDISQARFKQAAQRIRERVQQHQLLVSHVAGSINLSDLLTKAPPAREHASLAPLCVHWPPSSPSLP